MKIQKSDLRYCLDKVPGKCLFFSNGDCEADGVYAPIDNNGSLDRDDARPFREGESFPDSRDWVRIG